jgi:hypothetical protein
MNRHQRRSAKATTGWIPLTKATLIRPTQQQILERARQTAALQPGLTIEAAVALIETSLAEVQSTWRNDVYQAHVIPWEPMTIRGERVPVVQLSIRRLDRGPARDWRDFQRIKNQLVGPEVEAIELYPAESRLMDAANQFHLWCVMDPSFRFPFGYHVGRTVTSASIGGSVNRETGEETIPASNTDRACSCLPIDGAQSRSNTCPVHGGFRSIDVSQSPA